jgi:hypothetical protein
MAKEMIPISDYINFLLVAAGVSFLLASFYLFGFIKQLRKLKILSCSTKLIGFLLFSITASFCSLLVVGTQGYQGLTHEEKIGTVVIQPVAKQTFNAFLTLNNGQSVKFELKGDEVMVEANVLKWKPWSNVIGLKTGYRLDRIRGRYLTLADEQNKPRSIYSINEDNKSDIAKWREQYQHLSFLLDVEHGSASYVSAKENQEYEVVVTTNGLLLRPF